MNKYAIAALLLFSISVYAAENAKTQKEDTTRKPASQGSKFEIQTKQVGSKIVVCGFAAAFGEYSYSSGAGGSGAGASVSCVVVD